jgi:ComF family protein
VTQAWLDALLAVLLAPVCAACASPLPHPTRGCVCESCWSTLVPLQPPVCRVCGGVLSPSAHTALSVCLDCLRHPPVVDEARAIGVHDGSLRDIIHAFKYGGHRSLARPLAERMRAAGSTTVADSRAAVPVPLHGSRRRSRGFNQAADLARHLGLPVVEALIRTRETSTQTALPAEERRANVASAFRATGRVAALRGGTVLLVDDVRTTGATLDACAAALKEAGVRRVIALTAARVETPRG